MTLSQYWSVIVKQWRLIIICLVVGGLGAYIVSKLMTPIYQSTALVQITIPLGNSQVDYYSGLLASNQLVQTEATLATSDPVLREVASHYPGLTPDDLSKEVTAAPKVNTQLFEIDVLDPSPTRAAAIANDIATTFIKQQTQLVQQSSAQAGSFLIIAQSAGPVLKAARPNTLLNTGVGLIAGLLLGMLLAVLFEQLDTRVRTLETLYQLLGWPVLATIWQARPKEDVIDLTQHNSNIESYRILRMNIGFSTIDKPLHTLMVTSALPFEGKSVIAANLAIFMARAGKNTLLIDADLRHPRQHEIFGIPTHAMGFSNAILEFSMQTSANSTSYQQFFTPTTSEGASSIDTSTKSTLDPFIHTASIPNLCIMPSGPLPPNSSEILESKAMQHLFGAISSCGAEVVIFDTSPLSGLSDASIIASKVDGTLVVVDITQAHMGSLKQIKALLAQAGAHVLGCVVNKQRRSRNDIIYPYYKSIDEQDDRSNHNAKNTNSSALKPVAPDDVKQPENQFN